jgi:hypothetical protein
MTSLALRNFPPSIPITPDEVGKRLKQYEATVEDLTTIVILLARWAERNQLTLIEKMFARLAEVDKFGSGGIKPWLRLGWYPIALLMYAGGIAALSVQRYDALKSIFLTHVHSDPNLTGGNIDDPLILPTAFATAEIHDLFKKLPGHERQFMPMNEYLFKLLQPTLEDALFLGHSYEPLFDRFEILFALECSNIVATGDHSPWGPPGRFAWKHRGGRQDSPFNQLVEEVNQQGGNWPPLKAGFFNGSLARFQELAAEYSDVMQKYPMR